MASWQPAAIDTYGLRDASLLLFAAVPTYVGPFALLRLGVLTGKTLAAASVCSGPPTSTSNRCSLSG